MKPYFFLAFLALLVGACAPQLGTSSLEPLPTLDFAANPAATLALVTPQGPVATRGFKIRGWT